MEWSEAQVVRLEVEEALLSEELPHFTMHNRHENGLTTVYGDYKSTAGASYRLCLWLKAGYPHSMPSLYVVEPAPLIGYGGKEMNSYGASHVMHCWPPDWNNYLKICHCKENIWTPSETVVGVLMKGFLWLEAFEAHKRTGRTIDEFSLSFA